MEDLDLFEHYETLPEEVQEILDKYCTGNNTYEDCKKLVLELELVGYTCDYGLDAEPHSLKKLSLCIIRNDLQEQGLAVPVGDTYIEFIDEAQRIPYRYINEGSDNEQFEVLIEGEWLEAQSIDFDFIE